MTYNIFTADMSCHDVTLTTDYLTWMLVVFR